MYKYDNAFKESKEYFGGEDLPASVFLDKYALRDKNNELVEKIPDDKHKRIASELYRIELKKFKKPYSYEFIYDFLKNYGYGIPQGSPMYAIGNYHQYASLSNCFVVQPPYDSYGGILHTDNQLAQIYKRRGGCGTDISWLRPAGTATTNAARTSTGITSFMERFSNTTREVCQDGRRGALMLTVSIHHPQVLDFAKIKLDPTKVTGANISIRLTDEFMQAVKDDTDYEQRWPVDAKHPKIKQMVNARKVWADIIDCAWQRAEPGLLFWDLILRESPADCYFDVGFGTISTNPCSELPLSILDSCRLFVINLFKCVVNPFHKKSKFDFNKLYEIAYTAQRLMDDIVDLEIEAVTRIIDKVKKDPEPEEVKSVELNLWETVLRNAINGRRTGVGPTALGDTFAALGLKYGSPTSIKYTDEIYKTMKLGCYRASVDMAKELGPFPIWDHEKEKKNPFLLRIKDEDPVLYSEMKKWGRRNISLLTTAPTGSVSLLAEVSHDKPVTLTTIKPEFMPWASLHGTTSGIEPAFKLSYTRRKKINPNDKNTRVDFVDKNGDSWQEFVVYHPAVKMWMAITGESDLTKSPWYGCCAEDLDWKQRVKLQATAQKHVDHAISSTINLPTDVSKEKVAEIYETAWELGCKGITVYRDKCRDGVLVDNKKVEHVRNDAPKRPVELPCNVHLTTVKGKEHFVLVGLLNDEPYEIFAGLNKDLLLHNIEKGIIKKISRGRYQLWDTDMSQCLCENIAELLEEDEEAMTRLTSTALRHKVPFEFIIHQLEKSGKSLIGFAKSMARTLKKYIKDGTKVNGETCPTCGSSELIRSEGCVKCSCGFSKCN